MMPEALGCHRGGDIILQEKFKKKENPWKGLGR